MGGGFVAPVFVRPASSLINRLCRVSRPICRRQGNCLYPLATNCRMSCCGGVSLGCALELGYCLPGVVVVVRVVHPRERGEGWLRGWQAAPRAAPTGWKQPLVYTRYIDTDILFSWSPPYDSAGSTVTRSSFNFTG